VSLSGRTNLYYIHCLIRPESTSGSSASLQVAVAYIVRNGHFPISWSEAGELVALRDFPGDFSAEEACIIDIDAAFSMILVFSNHHVPKATIKYECG